MERDEINKGKVGKLKEISGRIGQKKNQLKERLKSREKKKEVESYSFSRKASIKSSHLIQIDKRA